MTCYNICKDRRKGECVKLLILSDSHGEMEYMRLAVHRERPDGVIHLGDHIFDSDQLAREFAPLPVLSVRGNCDFSQPDRPEELLITLENVCIFGIHGHRYGVKQGLLRAELAARQRQAQLLLFGHTHAPCCECYRDLWMLNPGTCKGRNPTYGIVTIKNGSIQCCLKDLFSEESI